MRVLNDPQAIESFEQTYSAMKTMMLFNTDTQVLNPEDFPERLRYIFSPEFCARMNTSAGRKKIKRWQGLLLEAWVAVTRDHLEIRAAEQTSVTETAWQRSLFHSATRHVTVTDYGMATPANIVSHMNALQTMLTKFMTNLYSIQLPALNAPASVSLEK